MIAITSALFTATVLGSLFESTRWIGIVSAAMLTFRYPFPSVMALLLGVAVFIYIRFR